MTSQQILQEIGNMAMLDHPNAGSSQDAVSNDTIQRASEFILIRTPCTC